MNQEITLLIHQLNETFEGDPWFGRSVNAILNEVTEDIAFEKPAGQHSIVELVWHMITWKEFTINCLQPEQEKSLKDFEENDWRVLDHSDKSLFKNGIKKFQEAHKKLLEILNLQQDSLLEKNVPGRNYNFRKLLYGIVQHDIYHLGQVAYIKKILEK